MSLPFSTSFVAPDGTLLTDFNPVFEDVQSFMQIQGDAATSSVNGVADCVAVNESFDDSHFAEVGVDNIVAGHYIGVAVRAQAAGSGSFYNYFGDSVGSFLSKWVSGSFTVLATGGPFAPGDVARLEADGATLTPLLNGLADIAPQTDSDLTGGRGALSAFGSSSFQSSAATFLTGNLGVTQGSDMMPAFLPGL